MNPTAVREAVEDLVERFEREPRHPRHVAHLAGRLLQGLEPWRPFGPDDFLALEAAASLHDIGWSETLPSGRGHHKASARMIRAGRWAGVEANEVEVIALVARYHRKAFPSVRHEDYAALPPAARDRVRALAAVLRVADGLDRRHLQVVSKVALTLPGGRCEIHVIAACDAARELAAARVKADLLRQELGLEVKLVS